MNPGPPDLPVRPYESGALTRLSYGGTILKYLNCRFKFYEFCRRYPLIGLKVKIRVNYILQVLVTYKKLNLL